MIAIDTNVLLRVFIEEDTQQARLAKRLVDDADTVFITTAVVLEFIWVLKYSYQYEKSLLLAALKILENHPLYEIEDTKGFSFALANYENSNADFSDYLILSKSVERDLTLWTFDKKLSKHDNAKLLSTDLN